MTLRKHLFVTCIALATTAACGTGQNGGGSTTNNGGSTGTAGATTGGATTAGATTSGTTTGTANGGTTGSAPAGDANGTVAGNGNSISGDGNALNGNVTDGNTANPNAANANGTTGKGSASVTGSIAGQSVVPKSVFYGVDGNTVAVIMSTDANACAALTSNNVAAGSTSIELDLTNFKNGTEQAFGNGTYTVTSTVTKTAPDAAVAISVFDDTCKAVAVPGGTTASGGSCGVTAGGTGQHDDLKATFTLEVAATASKLTGTLEAVYCDGLSKVLAAGGTKGATCRQ